MVPGDPSTQRRLARVFRLTGDLATQHGVPTRLLDLCQSELIEAMNRGGS